MNYKRISQHFFMKILEEANKILDLLDPINNPETDKQLIQTKTANIIYYSKMMIEE